jgi:hypothetical protein
MLLKELGQLSEGPTPFEMDAQAVLNGTTSEKVARDMRFMAARYHMLRLGEYDGVIAKAKVASDELRADILTKPLTGTKFIDMRRRILGLDQGAA